MYFNYLITGVAEISQIPVKLAPRNLQALFIFSAVFGQVVLAHLFNYDIAQF